ncbi:hypothetical protein ACFLVW_04970 [Chloroflexota bacterium]
MTNSIRKIFDLSGKVVTISYALGNKYKSINYRDLDGINWLKSKGLNLALLTGEDTAFVDTIAQRLGITNTIKGAKDVRIARLQQRMGLCKRILFDVQHSAHQ